MLLLSGFYNNHMKSFNKMEKTNNGILFAHIGFHRRGNSMDILDLSGVIIAAAALILVLTF